MLLPSFKNWTLIQFLMSNDNVRLYNQIMLIQHHTTNDHDRPHNQNYSTFFPFHAIAKILRREHTGHLFWHPPICRFPLISPKLLNLSHCQRGIGRASQLSTFTIQAAPKLVSSSNCANQLKKTQTHRKPKPHKKKKTQPQTKKNKPQNTTHYTY